jgi:uncharacterized protein YbaR (Trm112 family)
MNQPDPTNSQYVRRVVLPSGRSIEVVYYETLADAAANEPAPTPVRRDDQLLDLHVCPECDRELVYPVEWEEASPTHWEVLLRCPNCEWSDLGVFDQDTVDRFDDELDHGTDALIRDLKRLTQANMEDEAERFVAALTADAILPEDF